jgi:cold shock protein
VKGRVRDSRGKRRRGFDDDNFGPSDMHDSSPVRSPFGGPPRRPSMPESGGPEVQATVKWFNTEKGFGFVEVGDGSGDAFLHIGVLQRGGFEAVSPGATLRVTVGQGQKGPQVTGVLEVDESTATEEAPRRPPRPDGGRFDARPDPATAIEVTGTVKWFNAEKGMGFVTADDGEKDVFVHISVVQRSGLNGLAEDERVTMRVVETPKGRQAIAVSLGG